MQVEIIVTPGFCRGGSSTCSSSPSTASTSQNSDEKAVPFREQAKATLCVAHKVAFPINLTLQLSFWALGSPAIR